LNLPQQHGRTFQHEHIPSAAQLAGMAALVQALDVQAPVRHPSCISELNIKGHIRDEQFWRIFSKRYQCESTVEAHLNFAMRYENLDLLVLKRIFLKVPPSVVADYVKSAPTSILTRRAWYLYEFLTGQALDIPDSPNITAIELLDSKQYFVRENAFLSRRHRVRDNLLGTAAFCPVIRKTEALIRYASRDLSGDARRTIGPISKSLVARAASFMLLADSQASFQIEGERPPRTRIERWGRAVLQAGRHELSIEELLRLHNILIEDNRFIEPGLRKEGVFLGERNENFEPIPEFIGAKPDDVPELVDALLQVNKLMRDSAVDAVVQAAAIAFGFVYIHPFEDGNGRLHRFLIHHVLAEREFTPPGMLFPVSSVLLDWIDKYRQVLQAHSNPLMPYIEWYPNPKNNVDVVNDTADLYRYFDATETAEFLYECVARTIEEDLPREIDYLTRRDEALKGVMHVVEMPDRTAEQFVLYVQRNDGRLPQRRRKEFQALSEDEVAKLEEIVRDAFEGFPSQFGVRPKQS
jgi:hypothetical protein